MPDHGHTVSRTLLDTMLLEHAEKAERWCGRDRRSANRSLDSRARVTGVTVKGGERCTATR